MASSIITPARIRTDLYSFSSRRGNSPCVLSVVSSLLYRIIARNERIKPEICKDSSSPCPFSATWVPDIGIEKFLERIFKYLRCSPSVFVVAYAYIDRLTYYHSTTFRVTSLNVYRLLITSVMIAAKFLEDVNYNNAYYAEIGGMKTKEMNKLEVEFLFKLNFKMHVTVSVFQSYCAHLEREVARGGGYQIERILGFISSSRDDSQKKKSLQICKYGR
ncbi:hypothetical protein KI387_017711 [Taxus chinensis]|uniref:Cyclin n=1 Tax=Taxus chinensis TaxID=29808 RepID=A0AA38GJ41_TAXCH|nr:hypothetical protein KI387_040798 [Taxus chinensis]KAH9323072.1 hypothetical protein KI387_017711 [Taxus chinensis]